MSLRRSGSLRRRTSLKANLDKQLAWQRRSRRRLPAKSDRRRARDRDEADLRETVRESVIRRDRGCLLEGLEMAGPCWGRWEVHHLRKDGRGGAFSTANLVLTCRGHNQWVENEPSAAWELGLVVRNGETAGDAWGRLRRAGLVSYYPDGRPWVLSQPVGTVD